VGEMLAVCFSGTADCLADVRAHVQLAETMGTDSVIVAEIESMRGCALRVPTVMRSGVFSMGPLPSAD
jgi:AhpD family alkylhydroperoxidase